MTAAVSGRRSQPRHRKDSGALVPFPDRRRRRGIGVLIAVLATVLSLATPGPVAAAEDQPADPSQTRDQADQHVSALRQVWAALERGDARLLRVFDEGTAGVTDPKVLAQREVTRERLEMQLLAERAELFPQVAAELGLDPDKADFLPPDLRPPQREAPIEPLAFPDRKEAARLTELSWDDLLAEQAKQLEARKTAGDSEQQLRALERAQEDTALIKLILDTEQTMAAEARDRAWGEGDPNWNWDIRDLGNEADRDAAAARVREQAKRDAQAKEELREALRREWELEPGGLPDTRVDPGTSAGTKEPPGPSVPTIKRAPAVDPPGVTSADQDYTERVNQLLRRAGELHEGYLAWQRARAAQMGSRRPPPPPQPLPDRHANLPPLPPLPASRPAPPAPGVKGPAALPSAPYDAAITARINEAQAEEQRRLREAQRRAHLEEKGPEINRAAIAPDLGRFFGNPGAERGLADILGNPGATRGLADILGNPGRPELKPGSSCGPRLGLGTSPGLPMFSSVPCGVQDGGRSVNASRASAAPALNLSTSGPAPIPEAGVSVSDPGAAAGGPPPDVGPPDAGLPENPGASDDDAADAQRKADRQAEQDAQDQAQADQLAADLAAQQALVDQTMAGHEQAVADGAAYTEQRDRDAAAAEAAEADRQRQAEEDQRQPAPPPPPEATQPAPPPYRAPEGENTTGTGDDEGGWTPPAPEPMPVDNSNLPDPNDGWTPSGEAPPPPLQLDPAPDVDPRYAQGYTDTDIYREDHPEEFAPTDVV